jgi:hypothetical protein
MNSRCQACFWHQNAPHFDPQTVRARRQRRASPAFPECSAIFADQPDADQDGRGGGLFFRCAFNSGGGSPHLSKVCTAHQSIPPVVHNALSTHATDACRRILPPPAVGRNKRSALRRMVVVFVIHELAMSQRKTLRRQFGIENSLRCFCHSRVLLPTPEPHPPPRLTLLNEVLRYRHSAKYDGRRLMASYGILSYNAASSL